MQEIAAGNSRGKVQFDKIMHILFITITLVTGMHHVASECVVFLQALSGLNLYSSASIGTTFGLGVSLIIRRIVTARCPHHSTTSSTPRHTSSAHNVSSLSQQPAVRLVSSVCVQCDECNESGACRVCVCVCDCSCMA